MANHRGNALRLCGALLTVHGAGHLLDARARRAQSRPHPAQRPDVEALLAVDIPIAPTKTEDPLTLNRSCAGLTPMTPAVLTDSDIGDAAISGLARVRAHYPAP